jgi:hypothetical protein
VPVDDGILEIGGIWRRVMKTFLTTVWALISIAILSYGAGLDGRWDFTFQTEDGVREAKIALQVNGSEVTGKVLSAAQDESIDVKGTCSEGDVYLEFPYYSDEAGVKAEVKMKGKLDADSIKGGWQFDNHSGEFTAKRSQ